MQDWRILVSIARLHREITLQSFTVKYSVKLYSMFLYVASKRSLCFIRLMVPLLISCQRTSDLSDIAWELFSTPLVINSSRVRVCVEALCDSCYHLSTRKGKSVHFDDISLESLTTFFSVMESVMAQILHRSHPLLGNLADENVSLSICLEILIYSGYLYDITISNGHFTTV